MKSQPIARSAEPGSARVSSSMTDVPFVGRQAEFGALRACLTDAARGRGRDLLVGGEPGIGKTRFVEAAIGEARTLGFGVALGACDPSRKGGGLVDAPGRGLAGTKGEYPLPSN
jgi:hypothetical protein